MFSEHVVQLYPVVAAQVSRDSSDSGEHLQIPVIPNPNFPPRNPRNSASYVDP